MYGFIAATTRSDIGSFYSNDKISKLLNRSQPQITKAISDLKELGVITVRYEQGKRTLRLSFSPRWQEGFWAE
jgi:biotin operon repressor